MEDALGVMRNKEGVLGATSLNKKKGQVNQSGQSLKSGIQHLELNDKWNSLSKKEKQFCIEHSMKPTSYCVLKK